MIYLLRNFGDFWMKEIILNKDNIRDEDLTDSRIINNYIFMVDNSILLKKHHNAYFFIHNEDLKANYNTLPFAIKKIYELDYPFIGDRCLTEKRYYLIEDKPCIDNTEWISLLNIKDVLNDQRFNNPRVQDITDEIIEIISCL